MGRELPPESHYLVGLIRSAHGLDGEISVESVTDNPGRFEPGSLLWLCSPPPRVSSTTRATPDSGNSALQGEPVRRAGSARHSGPQRWHPDRLVAVESSRQHKGRLLLVLEGVASREAAEDLRGWVLSVPSGEAEAAEGRVLVDAVEGMSVIGPGGRRLGSVRRVLAYPAQDLLEVETASGIRLLPNVPEIVTEIDVEAGRVIADPPPGLFDESE